MTEPIDDFFRIIYCLDHQVTGHQDHLDLPVTRRPLRRLSRCLQSVPLRSSGISLIHPLSSGEGTGFYTNIHLKMDCH